MAGNTAGASQPPVADMTLSALTVERAIRPLQIPESFGSKATLSPSEAVIARAMRLRQAPVLQREQCVGEVGVTS